MKLEIRNFLKLCGSTISIMSSQRKKGRKKTPSKRCEGGITLCVYYQDKRQDGKDKRFLDRHTFPAMIDSCLKNKIRSRQN